MLFFNVIVVIYSENPENDYSCRHNYQEKNCAAALNDLWNENIGTPLPRFMEGKYL